MAVSRVGAHNPTRTAHQLRWVMNAVMALVVLGLCVALVRSMYRQVNPLPTVVTIACLVLLCYFYSYVFVIPDDSTLSATDRTLAIASDLFTRMSQGLTHEAALAACQIILPETLASTVCLTDGAHVVACVGDGADDAPEGEPLVMSTSLTAVRTGQANVFVRHPGPGSVEERFFPHLHAGVVLPLMVRGDVVGTLEFYYPRFDQIDQRQAALARGFADLLSSQLASFELDRQAEISARVELRALQSQVDPHFLFNTISSIVSLVRTEPEKARKLLTDFSKYYRQTLTDSESLVSLEQELQQGERYISLMQGRYGDDRLTFAASIDERSRGRLVPPFIIQPILENSVKHGMHETEPLHISLSSRVTDEGIQIVIEDNGVGMSEEVRTSLFDSQRPIGSSEHGAGIALANVLTRIRFFYRDDSGIDVWSKEGVGTRVTLSLSGDAHIGKIAKGRIPSPRPTQVTATA